MNRGERIERRSRIEEKVKIERKGRRKGEEGKVG